MKPDWKKLAPHRPVEPGGPTYIKRPAGEATPAQRIRAGQTTVLIAGPVGIGKSTELARAASELQQDRVACLVPLDRLENMRDITADAALLRIAGQLARLGQDKQIFDLAPEHRFLLEQDPPERDPGFFTTTACPSMTPAALATNIIREITRLSPQTQGPSLWGRPAVA